MKKLRKEVQHFLENRKQELAKVGFHYSLNTGKKGVSGSIVVGRYGYMLCGTWQPYSETNTQFVVAENRKIHWFESVYSQSFRKYNLEDRYSELNYKDWFNNVILKSLLFCLKEEKEVFRRKELIKAIKEAVHLFTNKCEER